METIKLLCVMLMWICLLVVIIYCIINSNSKDKMLFVLVGLPRKEVEIKTKELVIGYNWKKRKWEVNFAGSRVYLRECFWENGYSKLQSCQSVENFRETIVIHLEVLLNDKDRDFGVCYLE